MSVIVEALSWTVRLLEFIAQRPSLHFEVSRVEAYDIRDARSLIALYSVGWYVDLEISNRGARRTTVRGITLHVGDRELSPVKFSCLDWGFDPGDARMFSLQFPDEQAGPDIDQYVLRVRDAFGNRLNRKGTTTRGSR